MIGERFDERAFLRAAARDDPTRPIGDALLDQRTVAGIGNLWKAEACFAAGDRSLARAGEVDRRGGARARRLRPRAR